jgi:hypothetical protein
VVPRGPWLGVWSGEVVVARIGSLPDVEVVSLARAWAFSGSERPTHQSGGHLMSTHSITHRPIPVAAAGAAVAAVFAVGAVVATHHDTSTTAPGHHSSNVDDLRKHAGRHYPPLHGGQTQIGVI